MFSSVWDLMRVGGGRLSSFDESSFSNSPQLTFQKFLGELDGAHARLRSKVVSIGKWSVLIPGMFLSALHVMIVSRASSEMQTWSSLVHLFETLWK